jgi:hypothetical protein
MSGAKNKPDIQSCVNRFSLPTNVFFMKTNFTHQKIFIAPLFLLMTTVFVVTSFGQLNPGLLSNFGIEGDGLPGYNSLNTFNASNTDDWYMKAGGNASGNNVIDTTGYMNYYNALSAGQNLLFSMKMKYPMYTVQNGYLYLDGRFGRDQIGLSSGANKSDNTMFVGGGKNGDNPATWGTNPSGGALPDKVDIVDSYVHMRRNGSTINGVNSSHLFAFFGASTLSNSGNRYFDVEFYSSRIAYDTITGIFSNAGSVSTGGHTQWKFNANGSIKSFGDMDISFSFNNSSVTEISIWLWVSSTDYNSLNPQAFDFVAGTFTGAGNGSNYGYAMIQPKSGNMQTTGGAANTSIVSSALWGTSSKSLGAIGNNYFSTTYDIGQFAEGSIDLSQMGIDPAYYFAQNPCNPVWTRVMVKSRSSASFTSALQDFTGPYSFLDIPTVPATVAPPANLSCSVSSVNLSSASVVPGAFYNWTTSNGQITSRTDSSTITVNKKGTYYLTSTFYAGCPTNVDSAIVNADYNKPIAIASVVGILNLSNPLSSVTLIGGDTLASNYLTPFGKSGGLTWNWTGPKNFTSNNLKPVVKDTGTYTIVVTEARNGCSSAANIAVPFAMSGSLPIVLSYFGVNYDKETKAVLLNWVTEMEKDNAYYTIERSQDGKNFTSVAMVLGSMNSSIRKTYEYKDDLNGVGISSTLYYRVKQTDNDGKSSYSPIRSVKLSQKQNIIQVNPNPFVDNITVKYMSEVSGMMNIKVVNMNGQTVVNKNYTVNKGFNSNMINSLGYLPKGMYIAQVTINGEEAEQTKLIKN